jgi:colanic acid/amylovoran biosynthesis glycosyltransferase
MSKTKTMIVVTYKYPYEPPVEVFLHNELTFTLKEASKVLLVTTAGKVNKNENYSLNEKFNGLIVSDSKNGISIICTCIIEVCKLIKYVLDDIKDVKWDLFSVKNIIKCYIWAAYKLSKTIPRLRDSVQNVPCEILVYSYWFGSYSVYACMLKNWLSKHNNKCSIRIISRAHGQGDLYFDQKIKIRPGKSYITKNIDAIFPISEAGTAMLRKEFPNVDIDTQRLGVAGLVESSASCKRGTFIIVSCSIVNGNKRVDYIAKSISRICSINVKWVHFGDGEGFVQIKNFVDAIKSNNIEVDLRGNTNNSDILSFYANDKPDLFINLSAVEGLPVSIMEAMAYSIPVIATNVGATSEIVANNKNGYLVDVNSDIYYIASIIEAYFHKSIEERNDYRECAFNTWKNNFKSDNNFIDFAKIMW